MRNVIDWILVVLAMAVALFSLIKLDQMVSANFKTKPNKEIIQSDPNRPTFDQWGNKFDAYGKLLQPADVCVEGNPYCVMPDTKPIIIKPIEEFGK